MLDGFTIGYLIGLLASGAVILSYIEYRLMKELLRSIRKIRQR
jgi:hypothetical protein